MVIQLETERTDWGGTARMSIDGGPTITFAGFDYQDAERRGLVFQSVYERTGGCDINQDAIPTEVACMGNAAIAAYLYSIHHEGVEDIANKFEVSRETVKQYLSDFRHGRRH